VVTVGTILAEINIMVDVLNVERKLDYIHIEKEDINPIQK